MSGTPKINLEDFEGYTDAELVGLMQQGHMCAQIVLMSRVDAYAYAYVIENVDDQVRAKAVQAASVAVIQVQILEGKISEEETSRQRASSLRNRTYATAARINKFGGGGVSGRIAKIGAKKEDPHPPETIGRLQSSKLDFADPASAMSADEIVKIIYDRIDKLGDPCRTVILCDIEGYSLEETAEKMDESIGWVKTKRHRCPKELIEKFPEIEKIWKKKIY